MNSKSTIEDFLNAAAAKQPTPGGGSIAALAGALAASMGEMVLNYSVGKKGLEAFQDDIATALHECNRARGLLLQLMVEDQAAFEALSVARKQKTDAILVALLTCIRVPEAIGATAVALLGICDRIVEKVNVHLLSDLAVCADLAMATVRCSIYNVRVNLRDVTDPEDRQRIENRLRQMQTHATELVQRVSVNIWMRHDKGLPK
jgi:formiminotetrahydrofolate cyclodeaminase